MQRAAVTSNSLRSIGYDPSTLVLEIEFKNLHVYAYSDVPELVFRPTRARILQGFLEREQIYSTAPFAARLEASARANLLRALARLST